ncbi:OmpA family protein [Lujinxingia litoralis]|nr:OmpA family protein [Lujinxingia litoralis]
MSLRRVFALFSVAALMALTSVACRPDFPNCETDAHCADSEAGQAESRLYCVNGLCQQCRTSEDCGDASMECRAGVCEEIPGYCVGTGDCPGNQVCRENRCGPECMSNDECGEGTICEGGSCVAEPECSEDGDCGEGQRCRRGVCEEAPEQACQIDTVYFTYDSSTLDDDARNVLQNNAACIQERGVSVQIAGHADERGTTEYNIALSERRARSVRSYLTSLGVSGSSVTTVAYGDSRLVRVCQEGGPESCHRANRRAEFDVR